MILTNHRLSSNWRIVTGMVFASALVGLVGAFPSAREVAAQPPVAALPPELRYVPTDAAFFVHLDAVKVWDGAIGKAIRVAGAKLLEEPIREAKGLFGITPDQLRSVTLFFPTIKEPQDSRSFGVVLTFREAYDKKQLVAAFDKLKGKGPQVSLHTPTDRMAVVLVGIVDASYAMPQPDGKVGPLTAAIQEAATGTHTIVAASNLANLPDQIRGDDLPNDIRPFQPILRAETVTGIVDTDREIAIEVRVRSTTPARAAEVEKVFGFIVGLLSDAMNKFSAELGRDAEKGPAMKDVFTLFRAVQAGVKGATFKTTGTDSRVRIAIPADQPFQGAFATAAVNLQTAAARAKSQNNLKQIAIAMHIYHDTFEAFPPAAVVNKAGKPILSWRVLILPYIEQNNLYQQFKIDEPWDSPNNIKLLDKMPSVYAETVPTAAKANETHYKLFVGNGAAFELLRGTKITDFRDGTSNTIMLATAATPSPWTKPDDIAYDPEKDPKALLGFFHGQTALVGMADGSVRGISKSITTKTLHGAITRDGGEVLGDDF